MLHQGWSRGVVMKYDGSLDTNCKNRMDSQGWALHRAADFVAYGLSKDVDS